MQKKQGEEGEREASIFGLIYNIFDIGYTRKAENEAEKEKKRKRGGAMRMRRGKE